MGNILVTGATGQIGTELVAALRREHGDDRVIALHSRQKSDVIEPNEEIADVADAVAMTAVIQKRTIGTIYHLAALLSATGEKDPGKAWTVNMGGLKNILDAAVANKIEKVFWPSSIAAFGPDTPKTNTPQDAVTHPTTMYGVTKVSGELLCNYYHVRYGLDVRSIRYPGLISYKAEPGGGTTDYAVAIFYGALKDKKYTCFVRPETTLPMMYMDDAIRATLAIMDAPSRSIQIRTSYNLAGISFSAQELADAIAKRRPGFTCTFEPDARQAIADSWPASIDDSAAQTDWGWKAGFDLDRLVDTMIEKLSAKLATGS